MLCIFGFLFVALGLHINIVAKFRGIRIVVMQRNARPRELNPNPPLIILQRRIDESHPVVLPNFIEGKLRSAGDLDVSLIRLILYDEITGVILRLVEIFRFHVLLQASQIEVSELISVHRDVYVQLFHF